MSDANAFELTLQGIEAVATIAKEFLSFNIGKEASAKAIEMNTVILTAQRHALAAQAREVELTNRISKFEEEVMQLKDWNVEKEDYELQSIGGTAFAYMMKGCVKTSEAKHWLCQPCFENAKKSVLQGKEHPAKGRGGFGPVIAVGRTYSSWTALRRGAWNKLGL